MTDGESAPAGSATRLLGAASLIAVGHVASRLLGLLRERVIAGYFGTSLEASAFRAASRLPTMIYDLLVGGMLSAALVPVLASYAATRREEMWRAASVLLSLIAVVTAIVALVVYAAAPVLARWLGVGFGSEGQEVVATSLRFMAPAVMAFGVAGMATGILYALERFTLPAMAGAVYNIGFIATLTVFHQRLDVYAMALGVSVGALAQVVLLAPGLRDGSLRFDLDIRHPVVRRVLVLYAPIGVGLVVTQLQVWIDTRMASRAGDAGLATMSYGTSLIQFPHGFVAVAISLAILPQLSSAFARDEPTQFNRMLSRGIRLVLALILPASLGLAALAQPVVATVYEHGAFDEASRIAVSLALYGYVLGLPFAAVDWPLNYAFYARQNTLIPAMVGVVSVVVYVAVAVLFGPVLNVAGLAPATVFMGLVLADSAKHVCHAGLMAGLTRRQMGISALSGVRSTAAAALSASLVMALAVLAVDRFLGMMLPASTWSWALRAAVGAAVGAAVYVPVAAALGVGEIAWLASVVRDRLTDRAAA